MGKTRKVHTSDLREKDPFQVDQGALIEKYMRLKGWKRKQLAEEAARVAEDPKGINASSISNWINAADGRSPSPKQLKAIADALEVTLDDLDPRRDRDKQGTTGSSGHKHIPKSTVSGEGSGRAATDEERPLEELIAEQEGLGGFLERFTEKERINVQEQFELATARFRKHPWSKRGDAFWLRVLAFLRKEDEIDMAGGGPSVGEGHPRRPKD